jgi:hypothetical protein
VLLISLHSSKECYVHWPVGAHFIIIAALATTPSYMIRRVREIRGGPIASIPFSLVLNQQGRMISNCCLFLSFIMRIKKSFLLGNNLGDGMKTA